MRKGIFFVFFVLLPLRFIPVVSRRRNSENSSSDTVYNTVQLQHNVNTIYFDRITLSINTDRFFFRFYPPLRL